MQGLTSFGIQKNKYFPVSESVFCIDIISVTGCFKSCRFSI